MKKKSIMTLLGGILIGVTIGMTISNKSDNEEKIVVNSRNIENEYAVMMTYESDGHCIMCGELLEEYEEKNRLCAFCNEYYEGYKRGVKETLEKYDIIKGDL